jgi:hypothetical protein
MIIINQCDERGIGHAVRRRLPTSGRRKPRYGTAVLEQWHSPTEFIRNARQSKATGLLLTVVLTGIGLLLVYRPGGGSISADRGPGAHLGLRVPGGRVCRCRDPVGDQPVDPVQAVAQPPEEVRQQRQAQSARTLTAAEKNRKSARTWRP